MFKFLLAFSSVFAGLFVWAVCSGPAYFYSGRPGGLWLAALMVGVPSACAWIATEAIERTRPRRLFYPRVNRPGSLVVAGLAAGVIGVLVAVPMVVYDAYIPNAAAMGLAAMVGCVVVLLAMGRKKVGVCVRCTYQLSDDQARCPECGGMFTAVK